MLPPLKEEEETRPTTHIEAVALNERLGDQPIGQTHVKTSTEIGRGDDLLEDMNIAENLVTNKKEETIIGLVTDIREGERLHWKKPE